jgi:hypothetical protein
MKYFKIQNQNLFKILSIGCTILLTGCGDTIPTYHEKQIIHCASDTSKQRSDFILKCTAQEQTSSSSSFAYRLAKCKNVAEDTYCSKTIIKCSITTNKCDLSQNYDLLNNPKS